MLNVCFHEVCNRTMVVFNVYMLHGGLTLVGEQTVNIMLGYNIDNRGKSIMLLSVLYSVFTYRCGILNTQFLGLVKKSLCELQKPVLRFFNIFSRLQNPQPIVAGCHYIQVCIYFQFLIRILLHSNSLISS